MSAAPHPTRPLARPAFPTLQPPAASSQSSSVFQSYSSSKSSLASPSPASSAPLPSPSAAHPQHQGFFASLNGQQEQQAQQQKQQPQRHPGFHYQPNRDGAGRTAAETTNYLNQAALLAEAAKRAQMAVVMRDIEGMEL
ncbi:hypothetical protein BU26DRAFT_517657 [Trematosphaeria pertusa]|uniref:Uncharacterized protein n=1 Tax=Trematosphaeria pertusa TaxID=390896 RepID=A0A6A6IMT1_9PLEO|nr:uncharacterized protein BU26DRAFT_517657 [Trematosphaeria pertusa]KAF2250880.1 hypothetical protein BU26DRAFT_517657 [Trematosphaeria pertusa]